MNLFDVARYVKSLFGLLTGKSKMSSKSDTACVVVGMEKSSKYGKCPGSRSDSDRMAKLLGDFGHVTLLQDGQASKAAFRSALGEAVKKDLCILFYSGHGGKEKGNEYLCLNNGPFWDHEIWGVISQAKGRVFCIFDCCHSGHMYRDAEAPVVQVIPSDGFRFELLGSAPMAMGGGRDILVWSGCPADQYSYGDASGGVLTNAIMSAYRPCRTYDEVWKRASSAAKAQQPVRTLLGKGFGGPVFR